MPFLRNLKNKVKSIFTFKKQCSVCGKYSREYLIHKEKHYCPDCAKKKGIYKCFCCGRVIKRKKNNKFVVEGKEVCGKCYPTKTFTCSGCGSLFLSWNRFKWGQKYYCSGCYAKIYREFEGIVVGTGKEHSATFLNNPSKIWCGAEIECLNNDRNMNCFIRKELLKYGFSQLTDSSLIGGKGVEFASKVFNGDLLFNKVKTFCEELKRRSYYIKKCCGLHIHLETPRDFELIKKIFLFYYKFEDYFFNMLPKSRQNSKYCQRFSSHYEEDYHPFMEEVTNLEELMKYVYDALSLGSAEIKSKRQGYGKRYCWINLHSVFYRGTLEIRSHAGTIEGDKINNWFLMHLLIRDFLERSSVEEIYLMQVTEKNFLKLFPSTLQNYIKKRWDKFNLAGFEEDSL